MFRDRCLLTLLVALPLLIVVGIIKPQPHSPVERTQILSEHFWTLKANGNAKFDMILMGDSRVYRGLSPQAMETILPDYHILNFGFSSGGLNTAMFEEAVKRLDPASKEKTIVLGITPASLTPISAKNEQFIQEKTRPRDYIITRLYLYRYMEFLKPFSIQSGVDAILSPQSTQKLGYYQEFTDDGWVASHFYPEDPTLALDSYRGFFTKNKVSEELVDQVIQQTRYLKQQGVLVFAFRPPSSVDMVKLEDELSGFTEKSFISRFTEAGGTWLSFPEGKYHSYDGSHLVKESAILLSEDLATSIKGLFDQ